MPDERKTSVEEVARLPMPSPETDNLDALGEWEGDVIAAGTPREPTPAVPRTSTRYDPLTTAVLAEITRGDDPE